MTTDPPSQTHSDTSVESSLKLSRKRAVDQERWVYETLRHSVRGMADWELWEKAQLFGGLFEQKSSLHRARIGLVWVNKWRGATPWHPVEDSGVRNKDPDTNRRTVIWRIKEQYRDMVYEEWAKAYRNLARGRNEGS